MKEKKHVAQERRHKVIPIKMDATFFFERAVQSLDRYRYDKAMKYFRRAVEYEPDNPVNHCNLAGILSEIGKYQESNSVLRKIIDEIDPSMTECYFYMSNNYANMEDYESAEEALVQYLEMDPSGQFLEEAGEMMELLHDELERPTPLKSIKSREGWFEHDQARVLLEEGNYEKAVYELKRIIKKYPDFLAARNNLALAFYYMDQFGKAMKEIEYVLKEDPGNVHALCNLAIFYQHMRDSSNLRSLITLLRKLKPYQPDHLFKMATTMGIVGEHATAYRLFKRIINYGHFDYDPALFHYTAVAAYNIGRYADAEKYWKMTEKVDNMSELPRFFLSQLKEGRLEQRTLNYHYHLPFDEQFRLLETSSAEEKENLKRDPLLRSSFFWLLKHGDFDTKLKIIQSFGMIYDEEVEGSLRSLLIDPKEDDYLKKIAVFVLRMNGAEEPLYAELEGKKVSLPASSPLSPHLPIWDETWEKVMIFALQQMDDRYDMIQKYDLETLWVEYLSRIYPKTPKIAKIEGWSAALEYLTAKMHQRSISYHDVAKRYGVSITTVSKNVKRIDQACGLKEKMNAVFLQFASPERINKNEL